MIRRLVTISATAYKNSDNKFCGKVTDGKKTDIIPETLFTTYKRQREEYTQAYKEYDENHHISSNINDK